MLVIEERYNLRYSQSNLVKVMLVIEERYNLLTCKREMIHYHLRNEYFVTVNQFVMTIVE